MSLNVQSKLCAKMRKILNPIVAIPLCLLLNCQDKDNSLSPTAKEPSANYVEGSSGEKYDPVLEDFARTLAASMTDPSMRVFVKAEAAKAFDGDNDILVQQVAQQPVNLGTFEQMLVRADGYRTDPKARKAAFAVSNFVQQRPLLNIAVPVNIDDWKADSYEPLVVVSPTVADETKVKQIKAFDSKGNVHWLDGRIAPRTPVIVVGLNERVRMDATGQMRPIENLLKVSKKDPMSPMSPIMKNVGDETLEDGTGGGGGGGGGGGTTGGGCYFQANAMLQIPRMEVNDISVVESWDRGMPEICFEALGIDPNTGAGRSMKRSEGMPQSPGYRQPGFWSGYGYSPWRCDAIADVEFWTPTYFGNALGFAFWEQDSGGLDANITVKIGPVTISVPMGSGDDKIGTLNLYRCSPDPAPYVVDGQYMRKIQKDDSEFWIFFRSI